MGGRGAQDSKLARGGRTAAGGRRRRAVRKGGRPVCLVTGKIRYRDGHDADLALRSLRKKRSRLDCEGGEHSNRVCRK
jgi:hypothetical protein